MIMNKSLLMKKLLCLQGNRYAGGVLAALALLTIFFSSFSALAQSEEERLPDFFVQSFLDLPEDAAEASQEGKLLLLYFGQPGCPYCKQLLETNFARKDIADKTRKHFLPLAFNIFGDREATWFDGKQHNEKSLAVFLRVQFTPTVLLVDTTGKILVRMNGYYPPHRFSRALDYAVLRLDKKNKGFAEYMRGIGKQKGASAKLHQKPFFMGAPYDLRRNKGDKPLAVFFETRYCAPCDEIHKDGFKRAKMKKALANFETARFALGGTEMLTTPTGDKIKAADWARQLKINYTPSVVFFDDSGKEVFRLEAYVRPFHLSSSFEYVGSGAYKNEPEFQRFLHEKTARIREQGKKVELWK